VVRLAPLLFVAAVASCQRQSDFALPGSGDFATTFLLIVPPPVEGEPTPLDRVQAIDNQAFRTLTIHRIESATYVAAHSRLDLESLRLPVGSVPLVHAPEPTADDDPGSVLARGRSLRALSTEVWQSDGLGDWVAADLTVLPDDRWLPPLDLVECLRGGGCTTSTTAIVACRPCAPPPEDIPSPESPACPVGWTADGSSCVGGEPLLDECDGAAVWSPSEARCVEPVNPCPAGVWPAPPPDAMATLYVSATSTNGDGSIARPFRTIGEALDLAISGTAILVAEGTYPEEVVLERPNLFLVGVCAGGVTIDGGPGVGLAVRTDSVVHGVTAVGDQVGFAAHPGTVVGLRDIIVSSRSGTALWAQTSTVNARRVLVDGAGLTGVQIGGGARVTLRELVVRGATEDAVRCLAKARLSLRDAVLESPGSSGVETANDCRATLRDVRLEGPGETGLIVADGSVVTATRAWILAEGRAGGIDVRGGADALGGILRGKQLVVDDAKNFGVRIGSSRQSTVDDLVIRAVTAGMVKEGVGLLFEPSLRNNQEFANFRGQRIWVTGTSAHGISAEYRHHLKLTDVRVADVSGIGLRLGGSIGLTLRRFHAANAAGGLRAEGWGRVTATDLLIHDVRGEGIHFAVDRTDTQVALIERATNAGISLESRSWSHVRSATVSDVVVRDTRAGAQLQAGLRLLDAAGVRVSRFVFEDNGQFGAWMSRNQDRETGLHLKHGVVRGHEVGLHAPGGFAGGYPLEALFDDVTAKDNVVPFSR